MVLPAKCVKSTEDALYHLMKKYSFRIFLRDLIQYADHLKPEHLTKYCSQRVAEEYLATLLNHQILQRVAAERYAFLAGEIRNFGDTLEWFVAKVMQKEFASPATWGNRLKNTDVGGDYDVIACVEGYFVYIEVKSSPPKHIDGAEIKTFIDRVQSLRPDAAIFLEDTHLRMKDKLVIMFEEELQKRYGKLAEHHYPVRRVHEEIFSINNLIFISNTKPDLIINIGRCLKHFLAKGL
jgi:hypothetical protein